MIKPRQYFNGIPFVTCCKKLPSLVVLNAHFAKQTIPCRAQFPVVLHSISLSLEVTVELFFVLEFCPCHNLTMFFLSYLNALLYSSLKIPYIFMPIIFNRVQFSVFFHIKNIIAEESLNYFSFNLTPRDLHSLFTPDCPLIDLLHFAFLEEFSRDLQQESIY